MTSDELLDDLDARLDRGIEVLTQDIAAARRDKFWNSAERLDGKRSGLRVVKDWLRSYR